MADEEKKGQEQEEGKKKGGFLKIIIIALIGMIIGGAGGFFAFKMFFAKTPPPKPDNASQTAQKAQAAPVAPKKNEILPMVDLDPFIVNLADKDTRRYLKVKMSLEVSDKKVEEEVKKRMPEIRDIITLLLSSKTYADLSTIDGKLALKAAIVNRLNSIIVSGRVTNVYFTEFVVQ